MKRLNWIDNLRIFVIIQVVVLHTAVTYSGLGGWYYKENEEVDMASTLFFAFLLTFMQAYFMSMLFMVSGYFSQSSLQRKGTSGFIRGRFKRLGIPLLIYIFLLHPLAVKFAYPDLEILPWYFDGVKNLRFFSWTGPLWFVEALLIFTLFYLLFFRLPAPNILKWLFHPKPINVFVLIIVISTVAFFTRIVFPIGSDVTNLQFSYFSAYIFLFMAGTYFFRNGYFDRVTLREGKYWLYVSLGIGIPTWFLFIFLAGPVEDDMRFSGGWNWPAVFYALWESFFCVTFILAMIGIFKHKVNKGGPSQQFLSDHAFGVFVFHAPVLIGISMLLVSLELHPVLKFLLVALLAISASFFVSWLVRRVKPLKKVFS